jgi:hypothetical protein
MRAAQSLSRNYSHGKSRKAVPDRHGFERPQVARDLKAAGLEVEEKLDAVGIVTGKSHAKSVGRLRKVRGVVDVSPDHKVDIGPPDAPISW